MAIAYAYAPDLKNLLYRVLAIHYEAFNVHRSQKTPMRHDRRSRPPSLGAAGRGGTLRVSEASARSVPGAGAAPCYGVGRCWRSGSIFPTLRRGARRFCGASNRSWGWHERAVAFRSRLRTDGRRGARRRRAAVCARSGIDRCLKPAERAVWAFVLGFGVLGWAEFFLGLGGWLAPWPQALLCVALLPGLGRAGTRHARSPRSGTGRLDLGAVGPAGRNPHPRPVRRHFAAVGRRFACLSFRPAQTFPGRRPALSSSRAPSTAPHRCYPR